MSKLRNRTEYASLEREVKNPTTIKGEVKYESTKVYIPEIKTTVYLRKGTTLSDWVVKNTASKPEWKARLQKYVKTIED